MACFDAKFERTYIVGTPNFAIATIKGSNMVFCFLSHATCEYIT